MTTRGFVIDMFSACLNTRLLYLWFVLLLAGSFLGLARVSRAEKSSKTDPEPTFNRDIAPLVYNNCTICHRPGESAPFNLLSYPDVRKRGSQIASVIESGYMPPWLPAPGKPKFVGERHLSGREKDLFRRWVDAGMPEGKPGDLPDPPRWIQGWQIGKPDMVVEMPEPYTLPADGIDIYRNFVIPVSIDRTRYVRAVEIRPDNKRIVHHGRMMVDATNESRYQDSLDNEPGFDGMEGIESARSPSGHFIGWTPGRTPGMGEQKTAWKLDPGTDLVLQLHMVPTGKPEPVRVRVGLYFTDQRPPIMPLILNLFNKSIDIPPETADYPVKAEYRLPVDVEVYTVYPHAHYLGKVLMGYAILPNGEERTLIDIDNWDFNWQGEYQYVAPVTLPRGTVIHMDYIYDNSSENMRNPSYPPRRVISGPRSEDEMADLILQVMTRSNKERTILAYSTVNEQQKETLEGVNYFLSANPDDTEFLMIKGEMLKRMDLPDEAIAPLQKALKIDADLQAAHAILGRVYRSLGDHQASLYHFHEVLRIEPDDALEHLDMGRAYLDSGASLDEAIHHLRKAIEMRPDFFRAHKFLGAAFAGKRKYDQSIRSFRKALEIRPGDRETRVELCSNMINAGYLDQAIRELMLGLEDYPLDWRFPVKLGSVMAMRGELPAAVNYFQNSIQLEPSTEAYMGLGMARSEQDHDQDALDAFQEALEMNMDVPEAIQDLIGLMRRAGELDQAVRCLEKIIESDPRNLNVRRALGDLYVEKKNGRAAYEQFQAASEIAPESVEALHRLASLIRLSNQPGKAIPIYERILKLRWDYAPAHHELGTILSRQGDHRDAIMHFEAALEIKPDFKVAREDLEQTRKILQQPTSSP
jgi:tetratricopeptide (TPR) repeat protein